MLDISLDRAALPILPVEERPLPTYLSERSKPPSPVIRRNSDLSMPKDTLRFEHINTSISISQISGSDPQNLSVAYCDKSSTNVADVLLLPELTQITSTSNLPLSPRQKRNSLIQFLVLCWSVWLMGWNDGSTGPLLPRIQHNYQVSIKSAHYFFFCLAQFLKAVKVGFSTISVIFIVNCTVNSPSTMYA